MNLAEALELALSRWYSLPTGLLGQLLAILRGTPEGRAGRPGDALGVSAHTWNAWLLGARGMQGGRAPNARNRERIRQVALQGRVGERASPRRASVRAHVSWFGYYNASSYRTVNLDGLVLDDMAQAWAGGADEADVAALFLIAVEVRYGGPVEFLTEGEFLADPRRHRSHPDSRLAGGYTTGPVKVTFGA